MNDVIKVKIEKVEEILKNSHYNVYIPYGKGKDGKYELLSEKTSLPREAGEHKKISLPPKAIIFRKDEIIFKYRRVEDGIKLEENEFDNIEMIIFGIPPCDAHSFSVLDAALIDDYPEPLYFEKRKKFGIIGMACSRDGKFCFCTSVGLTPHSEKGSDIMIYPYGEFFYLKKVNNNLDKLWKNLEGFGIHVDDVEFERIIKKYDFSPNNFIFSAEDIVEKLNESFESDYWKRFSEACISCGICTYLCPTCHCYDIVDVGDETGGRRVRTWDSCQFPEFTAETSSYNPRMEAYKRQRQRVLHKFLYFYMNKKMFMCTGCGRCIKYCPVSINIAECVMRLGGVYEE